MRRHPDISTRARGGAPVDIGGVMEQAGPDPIVMVCSQHSVLGSLWFPTGEAQVIDRLVRC